MRLLASAGKIFSYCRHSPPSVVLPVDIGLDAVAVADVHGGGAGEAVDGALRAPRCPRSSTSSMNTLKAGSSNWMTSTPSASSARASWLAGRRRPSPSSPCRRSARSAMVSDDRHRPGQRDLELALGMRAGERASVCVHAALERQRRRAPAAPSLYSGRRGCPSRPCGRSRCRRRIRGSRARNAGATFRRRRRCRCRHPPATSSRAAWRRAWLARAPRPRAAIAATVCWARRARTASAGCRRRWSRNIMPASIWQKFRRLPTHKANVGAPAGARRPPRRMPRLRSAACGPASP